MIAEEMDVLLAEDNEDDVVMIREVFERAGGLRISVVCDGEQALRYLRREGEYSAAARPSIVLLDINMPTKGGFETLQEIKGDPELAFLPVVMLTTSKREEDVARSYAEGASSFVSKPFSFDDFVEVAREFSIYWSRVAAVPGRPRSGA